MPRQFCDGDSGRQCDCQKKLIAWRGTLADFTERKAEDGGRSKEREEGGKEEREEGRGRGWGGRGAALRLFVFRFLSFRFH